MIINDVRPEMETSTQLEEQFFSIQDQGMIFDILRNKMYSNPVLAICREISCNARDAHREVGKADIPIHIHLPNQQEPFYKIKDFGPGISPDRMSNIFIKYTASTKRSDNVQTGGFGLGAKTPFSYSDSFNIVTNYNGVRYNYACFIDETKIGKLSLLSESPTQNPNGTEIIIPVQSKDFRMFEEYTEQCTRHWKVKPIIKPYDIVWRNIESKMSGNGWSIVLNNNWSRGTKLIVDEIEYPVDISSLRSYADSSIIDSARGDLYLYFGVGELSLSASREQIYLDEPTKKLISDRLKLIVQEIKESTQKDLDNCENFFLANVYYRNALQQTFSNLSFLTKLSWNGTNLLIGHVDIGCPVIMFSKGVFNRRFGSETDKIRKSTNRSFSFVPNSEIYINDLNIKEITTRHVKKAFDNDANLKSIQIICLNEKTTESMLNDSFYLDKMNPKLLSSIVKTSSRTQRSASSRLIVFKFDKNVNNFKQTNYSSIEEDNKNKILCLLEKNTDTSSRQIILKSGKRLSVSYLSELDRDNPEYSFYGVDHSISEKRVDEDFCDLQSLDDFINEKILENSRDSYIRACYLNKSHGLIDRNLLYRAATFKNKIQNIESIFLKRINLFELIDELSSGHLWSLRLYQEINGMITDDELDSFEAANPELSIAGLNKKYELKYPLLAFIDDSCSSYNRADLESEHIINYVNLMDNCCDK
jgi:hypothetical protein